MNTIDFGLDLYKAIEYPRLHHQLLPDILGVEGDYDKTILKQLADRGHKVVNYKLRARDIFGTVHTLN